MRQVTTPRQGVMMSSATYTKYRDKIKARNGRVIDITEALVKLAIEDDEIFNRAFEIAKTFLQERKSQKVILSNLSLETREKIAALIASDSLGK